jgi:hypothetical protein
LKYTDPTGYRYGPRLNGDGSFAYDNDGMPVVSDMPEYGFGGYAARQGIGPIYDDKGYVVGFGYGGRSFTNNGFSVELQETVTTNEDGSVDYKLEYVVRDNFIELMGIVLVTWEKVLVTEKEGTKVTINGKSIIKDTRETSYIEWEATYSSTDVFGSAGGGELTGLSAGTERGIGLGGSVWGGAATMTYADEIASGVSTTAKGMSYLRVGGNVLGGVGFAATTYNNVVKFNNGNLHTSDLFDMGVSGGMLLTGVLISNPIGLGVLAVGGIAYGIYRLTPAADNTDLWINSNFDFNP